MVVAASTDLACLPSQATRHPHCIASICILVRVRVRVRCAYLRCQIAMPNVMTSVTGDTMNGAIPIPQNPSLPTTSSSSRSRKYEQEERTRASHATGKQVSVVKCSAVQCSGCCVAWIPWTDRARYRGHLCQLVQLDRDRRRRERASDSAPLQHKCDSQSVHAQQSAMK